MIRQNPPSTPIRLPSVYIRLSEILPSRNKSPRTGKPWAKDVLKLTFQGLEILPPKTTPPTASRTGQAQVVQAPASDEPIRIENSVLISEARMALPIPTALSILKESVDRDIAFHAKTGAFAFRLRSQVGQSVISELVERVSRVERLVDFVEVLQRHEDSLRCDSITLGKIHFTYGDQASPASGADAMDVDRASEKTYKGIVDFGAADNIMTLDLERGNPHIRVLDHLIHILNASQGLDGVATILPLTVPALRALDAIELAWTPMSTRGEIFVFVRAIDWYIMRYNLYPRPSSNPTAPNTQPRPRRIMFDIKLQHRRGEPWWYVRRVDGRAPDGDDIDAALKPIWNALGEGWKGMRSSAVAQASGMEDLLVKVDEAVRRAVLNDKPAEVAPVAVMHASIVAAPMGAQQVRPQMMQQQQQPTPSQSQSQSQGQPSEWTGREVVEID